MWSDKCFVALPSRALGHAPDHLRVSRVSPKRQREKRDCSLSKHETDNVNK